MVMLYSEDPTINPFNNNDGLFHVCVNSEDLGLGYLTLGIFTHINTGKKYSITKEDHVKAAKVPE